jgi:hypothetical protein
MPDGNVPVMYGEELSCVRLPVPSIEKAAIDPWLLTKANLLEGSTPTEAGLVA